MKQGQARLPCLIGPRDGAGAQGTLQAPQEIHRGDAPASRERTAGTPTFAGTDSRARQEERTQDGERSTIYSSYIRKDKKAGGTLYRHLRHRLKHRKRQKGGHCSIKDRVLIDERPAIVDAPSRVGDWEIDTIVGKQGKGAIVTLTEGKTRFLIMEKLPDGRNAKELADTVIRLLTPCKKWVHTTTSDNGTEFAEHKRITKKFNAKFFFAHPYSSWERGLNENTNGLIRQYVPKGTSFELYDASYIKQVQYKINRRPREKLNFSTPKKEFYKSIS